MEQKNLFSGYLLGVAGCRTDFFVEGNYLIFQQAHTRLHGLAEPLLLQLDDSEDEIVVFLELPVHQAEAFQDHLGNFRQEGLLQTKSPPVADGPPDDPPQHVAPPGIARYHPVAD